MRNIGKWLLLIFMAALLAGCGTAKVMAEQKGTPASSAAEAASYPAIVLYSLSWCPHCKQAKDYFAQRNIPYTNRDVEQDEEAGDILLNKYQTNTVPLIVIGNDAAVLRGFSPELFEQALESLKKK